MELANAKDLFKRLYFYDKSTYHHSFNVAMISSKIADAMGLSTYSEELNIGCALHDIGKIKIPKSLLDYTRAYNTENEYNIMKKHVTLGYELVKEYLKRDDFIIRSIITQHHERLNGSGYPYHLTAKDISIYAKICAVADTFDAIQNREYNKGKNAIYELRKGVSNNLFDERIVETLKLLVQKGEI